MYVCMYVGFLQLFFSPPCSFLLSQALGGNRHIHLMIRDVRANTVKVNILTEHVVNHLFIILQ